jgi:hypothetical protein
MKKLFINLSKSEIKELQYISNEEYLKKFNKGWSFSYSYSFIELRNIYLYLKKYGFKNLKDFTNICLKNNLHYEKKPWNTRKVLEQINSLKNFELITKNEEIKYESLFNSETNGPLTKEDLNVFRKIYFSYYRFCELHSWLISPDKYDEKRISQIDEKIAINSSKLIFPFKTKERFVDSFIFELMDSATIYRIADFDAKEAEGIKRFWDVYVKWGVTLGVASRYNLSDFNYELSSNLKSPSVFYLHKNLDKNFNLVEYLFENHKGRYSRYIYIPELVLSLAIKYRLSVTIVKKLILDAYRKHPEKVSLQKTSESLMKKTEINLIPQSNGFLFSHILLLR